MGDLKKRRPIIALFLSLITPGLGQMYNGRIKKGIVLYLVVLSLMTLLHIFLGSFSKFYGLVLFLVTTIAYIGFLLFTLLDALFSAIKLKEFILKPYNKWYFYVGILAVTCLIQSTFIGLPSLSDVQKSIKSYRISASSMEPTLFIGDCFIVDMKIYKSQKPRRGDIVVFEIPKNPSKDFVKRVIGLENEKVEIIQNKVYINDELIDDPWGYYKESKLTRFMQEVGNFGPVVVPKDSFFVLGDNRYNSMDSRFFGTIELTKIKGKALYIYWAKNMSRIAMKIK